MVRVLSTYSNSFDGGVLRVLENGLPRLAREPNIRLVFADLYAREHLRTRFADKGVSVEWRVGRAGPAFISTACGMRRRYDTLRQTGRHARIACDLRRSRYEYDVFYVHSYKDLVLASAALAAARGPRLVWHCHGIGEGSPPPFLRRMANACCRVLAISNSVRERLIEIGVDPKRIGTVYNAIDHDAVALQAARPRRPDLPARTGSTVVLVATASLRPLKGIPLAIEALHLLPERVELWITGDMEDKAAGAYPSELQERVRSGLLEARVRFLGFRTDIYSLMREADIVCVPSLCREGFGLVAAEGMSLGKPVVVSNRGGLPEVVQHGRTGLVFDPGVPGDLAAKIATLCNNPSLARELGQAGRSYSMGTFSCSNWVGQVASSLLFKGAEGGVFAAFST
jgi:glycosyltransferase involved in cell wall biosynthesis